MPRARAGTQRDPIRTAAERLVLVTAISACVAFSHAASASPIIHTFNAGNRLVSFDANVPGTFVTDVAVTGIAAGETMAGIDFRPHNGMLYGLGVNATTNAATLYCISIRTGVATAVGTIGGIAFVDGAASPVDFPDPAVSGYGFDVNPAADRIRVTTSTGLNFRVDPNTGNAFDGNLGLGAPPPGVNPDAAINGAGSAGVSANAYTNSRQNTAATTLYTLDNVNNTLHIQNPPNAGTQTQAQVVMLEGGTLNFAAVNGFDIPTGVTTGANNAAATSGSAFAALPAGATTALYGINLVNAQATFLGNIGNGVTPIQGLAIQGDSAGIPVVALGSGGTAVVRFNTSSPGTSTSSPVSGVNAGETLVGIDFRPQTGQLYGLGVNATTNAATLYLLEPTGAATAVGTLGQIAFVDGAGSPVDLPSAASGYGFDFNPTVDRIRVTTGTGLNFRVNPNNGAPVDGNLSSGTPAGINPDGNINGSGAVGVSANAYTNSFGQTLSGSPTTLYTLDSALDALFIQNPPNAGTQSAAMPLTQGGAPVDVTSAAGFDIPASVSVVTSSDVASGLGIAALTVGGLSSIYTIDLATGVLVSLGAAPVVVTALTLADTAPPRPAALFADGFE